MANAGKNERLERLRAEVADLCSRTSVPEPGLFLASIMSGVDPRSRTSLLRSLVEDCNRRGPLPSLDDWSEIVDLVLSGRYDRESVPLSDSLRAAEKLIEFLHSKLRAVDVSVEGSLAVSVAPLSDEEIERFVRIWSERY